ncbi:MAG: TIGR03087 family PEP-CTERM/XrtA system glycosyltransferase [Pseudomonadota bacterium]
MGDILFLAHRVPFPPNRGDKIRAHHLLKKLSQLGRVHVGCFADSAEDRVAIAELDSVAASHCVVDRKKPLSLAGMEAMLTRKPVSLTAFHSARLQSWVRQKIQEQLIDTVVIFSGQMGQYLPEDYAGRFIIDLCDVDSAKFENYAEAGERVWLNSREAKLLAIEEERIAKRADTTILISDAEAELFVSRLGEISNINLRVVGNGIDAEFFDPAKVEPHPEISARPGPHFVFTGQMDYPPNERAAVWAIDSFWTAYQSKHPSAEIHVVGRNPTELLKRKGDVDPGIRIWGEVPDVRPFIAAADCVVAPLSIARGVQNKVLEAMAMARPVLLTPQAATGIGARDGEHWMLCDVDAEAMSARFDTLGKDSLARSKMGENARKYVLDHHDWDVMLAPLAKHLRNKGSKLDAA